MRMSCNGCRVLRKGCSDDCSIRPCLQWIKSPQSQAHATIFLAKFYGRAGLLNLINSGPAHLRPAIFRSLLYEACGRIVNPIFGSVGLLWSGNLQLCESAVESVLKGAPITRIPSETAASTPVPLLKACDVRHVIKSPITESKPAADLHRVNNTRNRFKRTGRKRAEADSGRVFEQAKSHESTGGDVTETVESMNSIETIEASHVSQGEPVEESDVELNLTLGLESAGRVSHPVRSTPVAWGDDTCHVDLSLKLHA